jgi:uncharacterized protein (DUF697 family)
VASLRPLTLLSLVREVRAGAGDRRPLVVTGALAGELASRLAAGAEPGAVRAGGPAEQAALVVHVLAGRPGEEDERALRAAHRARVPVVAVQTEPGAVHDVPWVLATDVVSCAPGAGFPVETILRVVARKLGENGAALAARMPPLRKPLCEELVASFARRNALVGAAVFVPGADFPIMTLNQARLVLRLAAAHGLQADEARLVEVAGVVGYGLAARTVARRVLGLVPVAGWAVRAAFGYAATRALGEAAICLFAAQARSGIGDQT